MSHNFLKDAKVIKNSSLCKFDTTYGYTTSFAVNGNVDGWDVYSNVYMYGCWSGVLFGSTYESECYISRTNVFLSVDAEKYFFIEFMLYVEDNNPSRATIGLTRGKVQWQRTIDVSWDQTRELIFDIPSTNSWNYYKLNMGPCQWWQGSIFNLRFFPFINARLGDRFFLKYLRVTSEEDWQCTNTQCSYYQNYIHPCLGAGSPAYCEATTAKINYTTLSGINSLLYVNIDSYGDEAFELGYQPNMSGAGMAKIIGGRLSTLNLGGYSFIQVEHTDQDTIKIQSGTNGGSSSVSIPYSKAAVELGFYEQNGDPTYIIGAAIPAATGFDYASTRLLQTFELNALVDGDYAVAYVHNSNQFSVEAGRRDFNEIGAPVLISDLSDDLGNYIFSGKGRTLVDLSHRVDNNGRLKSFWIYGVPGEGASFKILRPHNDGGFSVVYSIDIPQKQNGVLYTKVPVVSRADGDILVSKGDLLGFYNVDVYAGKTLTNLPDATFCFYSGEIEGRVEAAPVYSYGVGGFAVYARGTTAQNNTILDIDLGNRLNISEFNIYGKELANTFEFNIASCLDVVWTVDLFGESHQHSGYYTNQEYGWTETHTNIAYGVSCLNDNTRTPDNGQVGTSYASSNGLATYGPHSYFYVNGDAEWLYSTSCSYISEYCGTKVPTSTGGFQRDPIAFTLYFPNQTTFTVHKSIIYFKEENNFRNLKLSYYVDPYYINGNADDVRFNLVPAYNKVNLDGVWYDPGTNDNIDNYVFPNPMTDDYYNYGSLENNIALFSSIQVDWNILGHEFNPIACKGFRIYTNKHNSTKINEIEVYSKITNDASLVDNATIQFSDYGDIWRTAGFYAMEEQDGISCYIGATPRYLKLTLESHSEFYINEFSLNLTEQVYVADDTILLEHAKSNTVNLSTKVPIKNVYDKPFDLTVDIPRDLGLRQGIVCWNKLGSEYERTHPELGPTPLYYKSADFPITMYHGQCAINSPCYGLRNLVDGKSAFYSVNGLDWYSLGTLSSGVSINVNNSYYIYGYTHNFDFSLVNARYWKFQFAGLSNVYKVESFNTFYNTDRTTAINKIFYNSSFNTTNQSYSITSNGKNIKADSLAFFYDSFSDGNYSSWTVSGTTTSILESNDCLTVDVSSAIFDVTSPSFVSTRDFEFYCDFKFLLATGTSAVFSFSFFNYNTEILRFYFSNTNVSTCATTWTVTKYFRGSSLGTITIPANTFCQNQSTRIRVLRSGAYASLYINNFLVGTAAIDSTTITKFRFVSPATAMDKVIFYEVFVGQAALISPDTCIGIGLSNSSPINKAQIVVIGNITLTPTVYSSNDNTSGYTLVSTASNVVRSNLYSRVAVDLGLRHNLGIIRNYGSLSNLVFISLTNYTSFSNNDYTSLSSNSFLSTYTDCRTLVVNLLCSDGTSRVLDKLGIYPDITASYCNGGGYNLEWLDLGNTLTYYPVEENVAYGSTISGTTNYFGAYYPDNAVNGVKNTISMTDCWGFTSSAPAEFFMDFGEEVTLSKIVIYGGYNENITDSYNKAYTFSINNTISGGSYSTVFSVTGLANNAKYTKTFPPVAARRAKLKVDDFVGITVYLQQNNGLYSTAVVGFIRELEVYAAEASTSVSSEEFPVVCTNLLESFNITGHDLINNSSVSASSWDNSETFFVYSDSITEDPQKVVFVQSGGYITEYYLGVDSGSQKENWQFVFDTGVYLEAGTHLVTWDSYYAENLDEISLNFSGVEEIELFATVLSTGWATQNHTIFIKEPGLFDIIIKQHIDANYTWGGRNPKVYRPTGRTRWVAVKRDTATNYSYDNDANKYGIDYLSNLKVYGDSKYNITSRAWWWSSDLSSLSNDVIFTKSGNASLVVDYSTSSGVDTLRLLKGDTFGIDTFWDRLDTFSFWLYVSDISNFDTTYGDISYGALTGGSGDFYYRWPFSGISLNTGWNFIELSFNDCQELYPTNNDTSKYLSQFLNISKTDREPDELSIRYKGTGVGELRLALDDFRIKRNVFFDSVKFNKGLCLTGFDQLIVPLSNVSLSRGSLEFWIKLGVDTLGRDSFGDFKAATIFTINNNNNDVISLRIKPGSWFEILTGNIRNQYIFKLEETLSGLYLDRNSVTHIGFAWSNDGTGLPNSETIRLYINGDLILNSTTTWEVKDTKQVFFKLGGGVAQSSQIFECFSSAVYDNLKVYNYCKTDFNINREDVEKDTYYLPELFVEISSDNEDFYGAGSEMLPIIFEQVPPNESRDIYIRANKTSKFSASNSTAQIIVDWLTSV